jgi:hypothetical protein
MLRPTISRISAQAGVRRAFSSTPARPLAKITIIGNLTDSPEVVPTSTGREIVRYSVASNTGPRDESGNQRVSFFRVTAFPPEGPRRDFIQSLQKGWGTGFDSSAVKYVGSVGRGRTALTVWMI